MGGIPFCGEKKGREREIVEVCIWTREKQQTRTENDPISNCGAFFGVRLAPCSRTWGGREPALGAVLGQRLSLQLEKVVPSLEGWVTVQSLPASTTPGCSG